MQIEEEVWEFPKIGSKGQRIWYTPDSVNHPAKMNTLLTRKLITTFTKPGDVVLDPMAGVGTTLVEGMLLGRNVVGVDLEEKFCKLIEGNLENVEKINDKSRFKLRLGRAAVVKGDSRYLAQLLQDKMDVVVTSPPYGLALNDSKCVGHGDSDGSRLIREKGLPSTYSREKENIGNLPHGTVDTVVTSPPYSGAISKHAGGDKVRERFEGFMGESQLEARKYSQDERNIGNLAEHGKVVDAVLTSPPFGEEKSYQIYGGPRATNRRGDDSKTRVKKDYVKSDDPNNIGKLPYSVDTIVTSPPFGERHRGGGIAKKGYVGKYGVDPQLHETNDRPLSDDPENIANLPCPQNVDIVITSPPYADGKKGEVSPERKAKDFEEHYVPEMGGKSFHTEQRLRGVKSLVSGYSDDPKNIGNLKLGEVDTVITSPPYAQQVRGSDVDEGKEAKALVEKCKNYSATPGRLASHVRMRSGYSQDGKNIGNLPPGNVDAVITSPPYADSKKGVADGEDWADRMERFGSTVDSRRERHTPGRLKAAKAMGEGYSDNPKNIGNLSHESGVDTIITSPPYEGSLEGTSRHTKGGIAHRDRKLAQSGTYATVDTIISSPPYEHQLHDSREKRENGAWNGSELDVKKNLPMGYSEHKNNIGNLKGETYLEAMLKVYGEMFKVLKPGGLAIIVLKNFIRNWKVVDLIGDTVKLCEFCGFKLVKRIMFVLPQQSFWRTNYRLQWEKKFHKSFPRKDFETVYDFETILVFRKLH